MPKIWASEDELEEHRSLFVEDTFTKEDQDQWLDMLGTEEQDILLSPLQPELNAELLVAILKTLKSATTHEIHRFARGTWNHQARAEDWRLCAEQSLRRVNVKRMRDGTCHVSLRGAVCQKLDALNMLNHEAFVFSFLARVDGQIFQCLGSIAESMFYYSQPCPVEKPMCYKLVEQAIRAGHIANLSNPSAGETGSGLKEVPAKTTFDVAAIGNHFIFGVFWNWVGPILVPTQGPKKIKGPDNPTCEVEL